MYSGLEKGQLDCASNGANELKTRSLWEVAKYVTMIKLGVYYSGFEYGFNRAFWKSISPAERRTMLDTIAIAMVRTGIGYQKLADEVVKEAPSHGVNVIQPGEDLEKSVVEYAGEAHTYAVKLGKDRFQMKDPAGLINRFEQKVAKWQRLLSKVDHSNEKQLTDLVKRELFDHIDVQTYGVN
jgi:TRAP-type C4-dicarboxylate transport system substrate-binding protein